MDAFAFDITEKSNEGIRMPLCRPYTDDVMIHQAKGDKEPREMYLTVLGPEANATKRVLAKINNRSAKKKANHVPSDAELEQDRITDSKLLAELITGGLVFSGKQHGNKWLDVDQSIAYDLLYSSASYRVQVMKVAFDGEVFI